MSGTHKLRPAFYRGVRFFVEEAGGDYGRRFADHEYPARDTPFAEDLGRKQRVWPITGYTLGPNFRLARDALLAACQRKGSGELIHPALGMVLVVCRRVTWSEQREAGGRCTFSIEFAEPGKHEEPQGNPASEMLIEAAADLLGVWSAAAFNENFGVSNSLDYVASSAATDVQYLAMTLENARMPAEGYDQAPVAEAIEQLYDQAPGLVHQPPQLCTTTEHAYTTFSNAGEPMAVAIAMMQLATNYQSGAPASSIRPLAVDPPGTRYTASVRESRNRDAWQRYCREQALREIGYVTPAIPVGSYQDGLALKNRIAAAFELAELAAADAGFDDVFAALIKLRSAIMADIDARNQTLVPLVVYSTHNSLNSLVLAWKFYQDANRDIEVVDSAQAINPAFMPRRGLVRAS